ncbi:MAG: indole-3-glycerol phosphate synthase TrpC, partial [Helicobacter sp.]|nr:indole-3-glycerol phosphate synthase TrpC [Helicobacter sp.]
ISVLTEEHFFLGNLEYLSTIRRFVRLPLLRKDFIIDTYQIVESAVYGADSLLLIAAILSKKELQNLISASRHVGIEPLVEVHSKTELLTAIAAGADIIGINHRNLEDFNMDMELAKKLIPLIPNGKIIVAESGLHEREQLEDLRACGAHAFLMGEFFMRQDSIGAALDSMLRSS